MLRYLPLFAIVLLTYTSSNAQNPPVLTASALIVPPYDSVSYTHSNGRETIVGVSPYVASLDAEFDLSKKWSFTHYIGNNRVYALERTENCTYYNDNSLASYRVNHYDITNNSITSYYYTDFTYNPDKTIDSFFYLSYSPLSSPYPWKGAEKYIYNNSAQLIRKHSLRWDSTQSIWVDQGASDSFFYNSNGNLVKHTTIDGVTKSIYDNNGLKIADTSFWGPATYADLWIYDYYPGGNIKSNEHLQYDINQQVWTPYEKTTYNYNGNSCTDITNWAWDITNNTYQQTNKTDYKYNSYNQVIQAGDTRYYYQGFPAGIPGTAITESPVSLYPIPATTYTNLEMNFDKPTDFSVIIFDMQGRMVKQFTDKADGHYKKNINVQDMSAGQYMLQLKTNNETISKNFTVIR